ncbi:hypothetical protein BH18CHL2_BH18CHL2_03040 [soil metagenome]
MNLGRAFARLVALAILVLAGALGTLVALGHFLAIEDPLGDADAIVALSVDTGPRTETAVRLWRAGHAPLIIFAGSSLDPLSAPSGELMKREALRLGVPDQSVLVEPSSATTEQNAARVGDLMTAYRIRTAILVTSPYHQRRASMLFRRELSGTNITFTNYPARDPEWDVNLWWSREPSRSKTVVEVAKLSFEVIGDLVRGG